MSSRLAIALLAWGLAAGATEAGAQPAAIAPEANAPPASAAPRAALELWGGIAPDSPDLGVLGRLPGMSFRVLGVRYARSIGTTVGRSRTTEYTFDLIPVAGTSAPFRSKHGTGAPCPSGKLCLEPPALEAHTIAVGINPVGLTSRWNPSGRFSPALGITGGALYFDRAVPTTRGARFNFTTALEAGVRIGDPREPAVTLTYRFHHLSNGGTARENPGVASHVVGIGVRRPWY